MTRRMYRILTREEVAERIAKDIYKGSYVNLGIGMPTLVANYLKPSQDVILHSENGVIGVGPAAKEGEEDPDLINAGKGFVTIIKGASFVHHADSFAIMRGGHIDVCVLGAFQISQNGDLANWSTEGPDAIPAVGGAMDLVAGVKNVWVATTHVTAKGKPKIVKECTYPLTGLNCVKRIYTDLAVIDIVDESLHVREMVEGLSFSELQDLTGAQLIDVR